ncbi:MAG: hypothetical protein N3A65_04470 [candidate division WOR-3 bacterium]|nr:hypothetical protein [candidate division WOR-3 bacterium]
MREMVEGFKKLNKESAKVVKLIERYSKLKEKPDQNAYLMEKSLNFIFDIASNLPEFTLKNLLLDWINREKNEVEKAKEEFRFGLGEQIKALFQRENKVIRGQFPVLRVGFYTIVLNFEFGEATIFFGPEIEKIKSKVPLEPVAIHDAIEKFDSELKKIKFDANQFYQDLHRAYNNCLLLMGKTPGEKVLLVDVLNQYVILKQPSQFFIDPRKENYREFSRVTLAYLIYLFKKSGFERNGVQFYIANFDATTDRKKAIWIPDDEEGGGTYYSYISFSEK